jgi:hypothetical protein
MEEGDEHRRTIRPNAAAVNGPAYKMSQPGGRSLQPPFIVPSS